MDSSEYRILCELRARGRAPLEHCGGDRDAWVWCHMMGWTRLDRLTGKTAWLTTEGNDALDAEARRRWEKDPYAML